MQHTMDAPTYQQDMALQHAALQELRDHTHRLIGRLPWITEDVAELVASINELASRGQ